jgi:protein-tyrosine phosphatase
MLLTGKRVLVTCAAGRNRAALIAGLSLGLATKMTPVAIVATIRQRRSADCLTNPCFVEVLDRYLDRRRATATPRQR